MCHNVSVTITSIRGECADGHKVGESWLINDGKTPGGICAGAYTSIAPYVTTLRYGGELPWTADKDVVFLACPDPDNQVIFEVRRLR